MNDVKLTQIASVPNRDSGTLYALDEEGNLWRMVGLGSWSLVPGPVLSDEQSEESKQRAIENFKRREQLRQDRKKRFTE